MKHFWYYLSIVFLVFSCNSDSKKVKVVDFISENADVVLTINNLEGFTNNLNNNDLLSSLNKTKSYQNTIAQFAFIKNLKTKHPIYIGVNSKKETVFSFSTRLSDSIFTLDSTKRKSLQLKGFSAEEISIDSLKLYVTKKDSVLIGSNTKTELEQIINSKQKPEHIKNLINVQDKNASFSIIATNNSPIKSLFKNEEITFSNFTNSLTFDADVSQDQIILNGITKATDSSKSLINVFKNTIPQTNQLAQIAPSNSNGFLSLTYDNYKTLKNNLNAFTKKNDTLANSLLKNSIEFGEVYFESGNLFIINTEDIIATEEALISEQHLVETYRNVDVFNFSNPEIFNNTLAPFINKVEANHYCVLDQFVVFAKTREAIENVIANYQNQTTFSHRDYYKNIKSKISNDASILQILTPESLETTIKHNLDSEEDFNLKSYKTSAIQFIYDRDFAHFNAIFRKAKQSYRDNIISEVFNIKIENDVLNTPQFVINHTNNQKEIIVQDITNKLYLISNNGKILWTKQLDGPILGEVNQIDMYKNSRLQLAFATPHRVYVIDRNGKDVDPFPLKFSDEITQPLAVFDYDKRRKYRLFVTQDKNVLLYDAKGKTVKGFEFESAKDIINTPPKHIRIGSKDYIVVKTDNHLHILSRRGKTRVKVKQQLNYSNQPVFEFNNGFITTTNNGKLATIDQNGNVNVANTNLKEKHQLVTTTKTLVSQSENILNIKDKTLNLDLANYTAPKLFYINNKIYVSVTDVQNQKILLFDSNAEMIENFPVYGTSSIDLNNIDTDNKLEFVTKGESNNILVYKIN